MSRPEEFQKTWRFENWIHLNVLNKHSVLDYFQHSDFYDKTCINEKVKQQRLHPSVVTKLEGVYYEPDMVTCKDDPTYFVIRKLQRTRVGEVYQDKVLALYYVLGQGPMQGLVYALPDIHSVLCYNISTAQYYAAVAFKELHSHVVYNRGKEHTWDHGEEFDDVKKTKVSKKELEAKSRAGRNEDGGSDEREDEASSDDRNADDPVDRGMSSALVRDVLDATIQNPEDMETIKRRAAIRKAAAADNRRLQADTSGAVHPTVAQQLGLV